MINFFVTLGRHIKAATFSLIRHIAMSLSSASAVTVTLILFSAFMLIAGNFSQFTNNIESDFRIHVVLKQDQVQQSQFDSIQNQLMQIDHVKKAEFSNSEQELEMYIEEKGEAFAMYRGESPLGNAFFVSVNDGDYIEQVTNDVKKISGVEDAAFGGSSVSQMVEILNTVRIGGFVFVALLTFLAIFLISNTIKISIYARNQEISIMRNVGATNHYIKMPFMIEGMFIGILGSIIPCLLTCFGYQYLYTMLGGQIFSNVFKLLPSVPFAYQICGILVVFGMAVGILGSSYAVGKYLKWKR